MGVQLLLPPEIQAEGFEERDVRVTLPASNAPYSYEDAFGGKITYYGGDHTITKKVLVKG